MLVVGTLHDGFWDGVGDSRGVWGSPVRYAKFESIRYFIDINILQNSLIDIVIDIDIFKKVHIDIDIDIFKNDHVDIDIDIDIFQIVLIDIDTDIDIFKKYFLIFC